MLELRSQGVGRYFAAGFLLFWLGGWVLGEAFALFAVGMGARFVWQLATVPATPAQLAGGSLALILGGLFMLVWLSLWTVGGVTAMGDVLTLLFGRHRFESNPVKGLVADLRAGPWRRRWVFPRAALRRIFVRGRNGPLVVETDQEQRVLTALGSKEDRERIAQQLRGALGVPEWCEEDLPPTGWELIQEGNGYRVQEPVRTRRIRGFIWWGMAALFLGSAGFVVEKAGGQSVGGGIWVLVFLGAVCALAGHHNLFGGSSWQLERGRFFQQKRWMGRTKTRELSNPRFAIVHSVDSDGDDSFSLVVEDAAGQKLSLKSSLNSAVELTRLGRWMAARAGGPIAIPDVAKKY